MIGPDTVLQRRSDVRYRVLDGEAVVIVQRQGEALVLNALGTRILDLLDGERDVRALLDRLEEEYEVTRRRLETDVAAYLEQLLEAKVVEPRAAT